MQEHLHLTFVFVFLTLECLEMHMISLVYIKNLYKSPLNFSFVLFITWITKMYTGDVSSLSDSEQIANQLQAKDDPGSLLEKRDLVRFMGVVV